MAGLGLYIHIPFCRTRCGYCAFNSRAWPGKGPVSYLAAVGLEMGRVAEGWGAGREFDTIFIGGGTPTIFSGEELAGLLNDCRRRFRFVESPEITVETNPNTVTGKGLLALHRAGVNRLSIGVQSFDDRLLAGIGRSHSADQAVWAVAAAREAGFANLNLDLIYGLPGQTLAAWRRSLLTALALEPEHLALYELSVEPGTPFAARKARGELSLPDDDHMAGMEALARAELTCHGFQRYEISNYSRPGFQCRHNLNYWRNGPYVGLGAGAVSSFDGLRLKNVDEAEAYAAKIESGCPAFQEGEALGHAASFRETVIMGLRLLEGVRLAPLRARYDLDPLTYYGPTLERLRDRGLVAWDEERLWLTPTALPVAHQVLADLV